VDVESFLCKNEISCNSCDVVFPFEKEISSLLPQQRMKQDVIRPEGIDIFRFRNELDISVRQPYTQLEIVGMIFSPFFIIPTIILFTTGTISLLVFLIALFIVLVPYVNLFFRSNHKIHVNIDDKFLYIEWRPKKLVKDKKYEISEIDQIYTKSSHGQHFVYMIVNGQDGQKHIPLIKNVGSLSKARYLEQEIENHLDITDKQVPEESI